MYVELKHVVKLYDTYRAADDINLSIEEGAAGCTSGTVRQRKNHNPAYDCRA